MQHRHFVFSKFKVTHRFHYVFDGSAVAATQRWLFHKYVIDSRSPHVPMFEVIPMKIGIFFVLQYV